MSTFEETGAVSGQTIKVIGFGRRFVAYLVDAIVLSLVSCLVGGTCGMILAFIALGGEESANFASLLGNCVGIIISFLYFTGFWALADGKTPGKMALGIKVIGVDGSRMTWGKSILRFVGYIVSAIVFYLGFIWLAFDKQRQGWHDKIASTYVVEKDVQFSATDDITFVPSDGDVGWIWAIVAIVLLLAIPICTIAVLLLLGPTVGNTFSNIIEELATPTP